MSQVYKASCIVINLCFILGGCLSTGTGTPGIEQQQPVAVHEPPQVVSQSMDLYHWITQPGQNQLFVVGVSGRQSRPGAEIDIAREDAARKISMYYRLQVEVENIQSIGSGFFDYFSNSNITVSIDEDIDRYLDRLTFDPERDVFTRNNAVFIRFTYPDPFPGVLHFRSERNAAGRPNWTVNYPDEINGFMAGVGFVRRQERIRDAVRLSSEAAAASLASRISSQLRAGETAIETRSSTQSAAYTLHVSSARFTNFLVIETWIDPDSDAVWTLAVARPIN